MSIKQIIVVRKDLNMRKGKIAVQACHASMAVLLNQGEVYTKQTFKNQDYTHPIPVDVFAIDPLSPVMKEWIEGLFTKVCVSVDSEDELLRIYAVAEQAGIPCALITDAGLTEFNGVPTKTCCAIGPASEEVLKPITGHLKLL
jgi:PTH2 family peptidyl-tRNA hydrolase